MESAFSCMSGEVKSMAVRLEGFSIRAYVSKARTFDVAQCWPFVEITTDKEEIERWLAPMTSRKFRWWFDEQSNLPEESKPLSDSKSCFRKPETVSEKPVTVCPVCQGFRATKVNAMNAHIERCLVNAAKAERRKIRKEVLAARCLPRKGRLLKKRSIGELFDAAAPPEMVRTGEDERENHCKLKGKKNRKNDKPIKAKGHINIFDYLTQLDKEKVKNNKLKVPSCVAISGQVKRSLINERLYNEFPVTKRSKSSSMNSSFKQNKLKTTQASDFGTKDYGSTVCSKLKNQEEVISGRKASLLSNLDCSDRENFYHVLQVDRYAQFFGRNDMIRPTKRSSLDLHHIESLCKVFSDVMTLPSVNQHVAAKDEALEHSGSREEVVSITGGSRDIRDHIDPKTSNFHKDKGISDETFKVNHTLQAHSCLHFSSCGYATASHNLLTKDTHKLHNVPITMFSTDLGTHAGQNSQGTCTSNKSLPAPFAACVLKSAGIDSLPDMKTAPLSLPCQLAEPRGRYTFFPETNMRTSTSSLQLNPSSNHFPEDLVSGISSSEQWKIQRTSLCRSTPLYKAVTGLPLKSQGEVIHFHSGDGETHKIRKQSITIDSFRGFPTQNPDCRNGNVHSRITNKNNFVGLMLMRDKLTLNQEENHWKEYPGAYEVSGSCNAGIQNTGREEIHQQIPLRPNKQPVHQLGSEQNPIYISPTQGAEADQKGNQAEKVNSQLDGSLGCRFPLFTEPMMRMMDEVVTVAQYNKICPGFKDGRMCNDEEAMAGHHPTMIGCNKSLNRHSETERVSNIVSQNLIGTCIVEAQGMSQSPGLQQMKALDPGFASSHLKKQAHMVVQNDLPMNKGDHGAKMRRYSIAFPSQALLNEASKLRNSSVSGTGSPIASSQISMSEPTSREPSNGVHLNPCQLKSNLFLAHGAPTFQFPFSIQDSPQYGQQPWSLSLSKSLPQHTLNAPMSKGNHVTSAQFSYVTRAKHYSHTISGANSSASPSRYLTSQVSGPAPFVPIPQRFERISSSNMEDLDHSKKTTKRLATRGNGSPKLMKKANLEIHEGSDLMNSTEQGTLKGYRHYTGEALEFHAFTNEERDAKPYSIKVQKDVYKISSRVNSSTVDAVLRSGPTKLTAGAKHILKPSEPMDQDNARPTHSTIPFGAVNNFEVSGSEKEGYRVIQLLRECLQS